MIRIYTLEKEQELTEEQLTEIREAEKHPITFDVDCEELSPAMQKALRCVVQQRNRKNA